MKLLTFQSLRISLVGLALAALAFLPACTANQIPDNPDEPDNLPYTPIEVTATQTRSIASQNDFGLKMFRALGESQQDNYLYSPLSMNMLLAMVANGTSGLTLDEFTKALGADNIDDINAFYRLMLDKLPAIDKSSTLTLANAAFSTEKFGKPAGDFLDLIGKWYDAEYHVVTPTDFQNTVNQWISRKTDGTVPSLVVDGDEVILNAMYFLGAWDEEYSTVTDDAPVFNNIDGSTAKPVFMKGSGITASLDEFIVVDDLFGNGHFEFIAIMPSQESDFNLFLENFDSSMLDDVTRALQTPSGSDIVMPRFSLSNHLDILPMQQALKKSGITRIFEANQEKTLLEKDGFDGTGFQQKNNIDISEQGARASAVSSMGPGATFNPEVCLDRPYIMLIRERSTGVILMLGAIRKF